MPATRRDTLITLLSTLTAGGLAAPAFAADAPAAKPLRGTLEMKSITSKRNGFTYPLFVYLPPGADADRATLPIVYMLDAESRFRTMVDIAEANSARVIVLGIGNEENRSHDYVPANGCTEDGGGEAAFLDFVLNELVPFVDASVGGDPKRRALQGHSHGGSFAIYAMLSEMPGTHHFTAYLAADPSIRCLGESFFKWETAYRARTQALPVRLHISYANKANERFIQLVESRHYAGLTFASKWYPGGHNGMVQQGFTDSLQFAFGQD